ncbi:MAG: sigma-54-dependent transcriptional regulator [Longimicrobiales bacterium]
MPDHTPTVAGRILLVDDDRAFRVSTSTLLREEGHRVVEAADGPQAVEALKEGGFDLVLLDLRMPGIDGIQFVEVLRRWGEGTPILMISGFGTVETAVKALHTGADDFLTKPVEPDVLTGKVADLLERRPSLREGAPAARGGLVGRAPAMRELFRAMERVAPADTTVLIQGDTGTGKELVAKGIHRMSGRKNGPFIAVNCAALAENLLESELFGHVKGAFTGAVRDKPGLFQAAHGGTLFLDEVGDISQGLQHRLLRVLQEREVLPVGDVKSQKVDVRVLAATHKDLREEIRAGRFREDLYYRLNVFPLKVPPLRARRADIPLLVEAFLRERAGKRPAATRSAEARPEDAGGPGSMAISPLAMRLLQSYAWPGNVRELFSVLESALIRVHGGSRIEAQHLPAEVREGEKGGATDDEEGPERYVPPDSPGKERETILAALDEAAGVRSRAARILGMGRTTLWRKMKEYGIEMPEE